MLKFTLAFDVRVSTASGEASFADSDGNVYSNDTSRHWLNLPAGTEVQVCAAFPKTHTWMVTLTQPQDEDEVQLTQGAVFRKASYDKLVGAAVAE